MVKRFVKWLHRKEREQIEINSKSRREDDNRLLYLLDKLERKDALVREQNELYDTLFNSIPVFIWYVPDMTTMGVCNDAFADFFGIKDKSFFVGKKLIDLMPPKKAMICLANNRRVFEGYEVVTSEEWLTRHDGVERLWQITKTPKGNGHVEYAVACGVDITDLREAENKNKAILEAIPDLMFINDRDGNYLDFHTSDTSRLAFPPEEVLSKNLCDLFEVAKAQECYDAIAMALDTKTLQRLEYSLFLDGKMHDFEARIVPLNGTKVLSIIRDITETDE